MTGIDFDRLGLGALRHHTLLVRIDRPVCGGHHVPGGLGLPGGICDLMGERVGGDRHLRYSHVVGLAGGISAAKSAAKCVSSIHQFPLLSGLNALDACGRACSIDAQLSPSSSANAAM